MKDNYNFILVISKLLIKIVYYKPIVTYIDTTGLAVIIISMIIIYYHFQNSIIRDKYGLFISKFRLSLCYFLSIK